MNILKKWLRFFLRLNYDKIELFESERIKIERKCESEKLCKNNLVR